MLSRSFTSLSLVGSLAAVLGSVQSSAVAGSPPLLASSPPGTVEVVADIDPAVCLSPSSPLTLGADGNLYGTMSGGGRGNAGCLYRVTPKTNGAGRIKVLHHFGRKADDGAYPSGDLRLNVDGSLLGSTVGGGRFAGGTVFRATPMGEISILRHFGEDPLGYIAPNGPPLRATDGQLYGGVGAGGGLKGAIYAMREDGSDFRILHAFGIGEDLWRPEGPLLQASDGALYGTTTGGPGAREAGGVYRLTLEGGYRVLHTMDAVGDGVIPRSGMIQGQDGALYGTNTSCGGDGNCFSGGTVFRMTPGDTPTSSDRFEVIYTGGGLTRPTAPGELPAGLLQLKDGSLWGTSYVGGAGYGTVYRLALDGTMTVMHALGNPAGGLFPNWRLTRGADGWLYTVTNQGGAHGVGAVFRIKPN